MMVYQDIYPNIALNGIPAANRGDRQMTQENQKPPLSSNDCSEQLKAYAKAMFVSLLWSGVGLLEKSPSTTPNSDDPNREDTPEPRGQPDEDAS